MGERLMGKQAHDLGVRKRRLQEGERTAAINRRRTQREMRKASHRVRDEPLPANYYGPPWHVRMAAFEMRQAGMPDTAERIMDGRIRVEPPDSHDGIRLSADRPAPNPDRKRNRPRRRD